MRADKTGGVVYSMRTNDEVHLLFWEGGKIILCATSYEGDDIIMYCFVARRGETFHPPVVKRNFRRQPKTIMGAN